MPGRAGLANFDLQVLGNYRRLCERVAWSHPGFGKKRQMGASMHSLYIPGALWMPAVFQRAQDSGLGPQHSGDLSLCRNGTACQMVGSSDCSPMPRFESCLHLLAAV